MVLSLFLEILHPEDISLMLRNMKHWKTAHDNEVLTTEYRMRHKDGSWRWLRSQDVVFARDEQNRVTKVLGTAQDISDRKQVEATLRESEERLRLAFQAAQMGNWDWDLITNKIIWSEGLERIMGLEPGKFDQRMETVVSMFHPDDRERIFAAINRTLEDNQEYDIEFRFMKPDGSIRWAASQAIVLRDNAGIPLRMLGVDVDITERKESEKALKQKIEREQALNRVVQVIRQSLDLDTIFATTTTEIAQLMQARRVAILQYLPERNCCRVMSEYRQTSEIPNTVGLEIPHAGNSFAKILKGFEIVQIDSPEMWRDQLINVPMHQEFVKMFPEAWLFVPLIVNRELWGSLSLINSQLNTKWTDSQIELAQAVGNQLAIAIHQSQLYQQTQRQARRELALN